MGVERRSNCSGRYLYRAERRGAQVVRRYVGTMRDPVVATLARVDRLTLAERQAMKDASHQEQDRYLAAEQLLDQLEAVAQRLERAYCLAAGKGRRHRNSRMRERTMRAYDENRVHELPELDAFNKVVYRAELGDDEALQELRAMLKNYPMLWKDVGDLALIVERQLIELSTRGSVLAAESLRCKVASMRAELGGSTPSLPKRLVVERIIASWLDLQIVQIAATEPRTSKTDDTFWQKKLDRAQRRHLEAIAALDDKPAERH